MSIKPVDMQVIVPKSSEVLKSNNNLLTRHDKEQYDFSNLIQKQIENKQKQVFEPNKTENNIKKDKKENNKNKRDRNKKDKNKKEGTSIYDITI